MSLRTIGATVAVLAAVGAGCSSTSYGTTATNASAVVSVSAGATKAYCADATKLKGDLEALVSFDLVTKGSDALNVQLKTVRADFDRLRVSANDVAKVELDVLERSLTGVDASVGRLGPGEISTASLTDVMRAAGNALTAGAAVASKLADSCG